MFQNFKTAFIGCFKKNNLLKTFTIFFSIIGFIYLLREKNTEYINLELTNHTYPNYFENIGIGYLKTLIIVSTIFLILKPFYKNKQLEIISAYYPLILAIFGAVFLKKITKTYNDLPVDFYFFNPLLITIFLFIIAIGIYNFYLYIRKIKEYSVYDYIYASLYFTIGFIFLIPVYLLKQYFYTLGLTSISIFIKFFNVFVGIFTLIIYFLTNQKEKTKTLILTFYILITSVLFALSHNYKSIFTLKGMPVNIISICFILFLLLRFKKCQKLFNFSLFLSLSLCILLIFPELSSSSVVGLIENTYLSLFIIKVGLLYVFYNFYKVPKTKDIFLAFLLFSIYYILVVLLDVYLINYDNEIDILYLNGYKLEEKFFFLKGTKKYNYEWQVHKLLKNTFMHQTIRLKFYHLFLILTYIVLSLLNFLILLITKFIYRAITNYYNVTSKIKKLRSDNVCLYEKLTPEIKEAIKMSTASLEIKNFSKKYAKNEFYSAKNINYFAEGGKVVGIVGHNGAGKSTLIKSLVGIQTITSGTMKVCGFDIYKNPTEAKYLLGYVSDNHALYEELTGREYITFVAKLYSIEKEQIKEKLEELVTFFNIKKHIDREIRTYSHGMKQKISIISSLIHEPKVWVLDEPLTGLDPTSSYQLKQKIKEHARKGNIVIFSSHIIEVVENLCDEIVIIKRGEMVLNDSIKNLKDKKINLEDLYIEIIKDAS